MSVHTGNDNLVSWRWLATDPDGVTFNLYRGAVKVNSSPITTTDYLHKDVPNSADYTVRAIVGGAEQPASPERDPVPPGVLRCADLTPGGRLGLHL
ncbi:Rhamnogalacturonan lyase OS=Streptomyces antimycoticus OX=68175 GN=SANT12839_065180 PE=4 SV=1 [Streptomyces antimycoticus]